ncbi:pyridoxine/pyridoxamine 5'-phosphate oxidase [Kineococcus rhizosphaerae]|uniref:pyridoxine/pyridoxamine 5'-phosphate oxidase n=1 Tax=Kineococcus rhizosphaerae TaxID=559628 RepID=UPI000D05C8FD|nr:pyridoxal 5'-phosphate synthase [Kineococcus rhizosphaerae]
MRSELSEFLAGLSWPRPQSPEFDPEHAPADPVVLFGTWLREAVAAGVPAAHVMTLATVDAAGRPDARVTVLEDVDEHAFWVAASESSPKGKQLGRVPVAALVFHWPQLGRQVRVRGTVRPADAARTEAAFERLSAHARAEALVDRQSRPLHDEAWLSNALGDPTELLELEVPGAASAPAWRLWGVDAGRMEFFQASTSEHHQRLRYSRTEQTWTTELLRP